jgi:hypothetical protein
MKARGMTNLAVSYELGVSEMTVSRLLSEKSNLFNANKVITYPSLPILLRPLKWGRDKSLLQNTNNVTNNIIEVTAIIVKILPLSSYIFSSFPCRDF